MYLGSVLMYLSVILPNLRALANPTDEYYVHRGVYEGSKDRQEGQTNISLALSERVSLVQVIAATNVIIMALLAGVLLLQGGEWQAIRQDRLAEEKMRGESIAQLEATRTQDKKTA